MQNNVVKKVNSDSEVVNDVNVKEFDENKKNSLKEKISGIGIIKKIRSIKHIEYIVAAILIAILLLMFFKNFNVSQTTKKTSETSSTTVTMTEYSRALQEELDSVLSKIKGAGAVSSMVTFEAGPELIPAYSVEESNKINDYDNSLIKKPIVVNGELLVIKEMIPIVKGVVIVTKGGDDSKVRFELKKATMTLLNISYDQIEVFTMK